MTQRNESIFNALKQMANFFGKEINTGALEAHTEALMEYPDEDIHVALKRARIECEWYPMPAKLISMMHVSPKSESEQIVKRIFAAIQEFGRYKPRSIEVQLGSDIFDHVIGGLSGLINICDSTANDRGILTAQLRNAAASVIEQRILNNVKDKNKLIKNENPNILGT